MDGLAAPLTATLFDLGNQRELPTVSPTTSAAEARAVAQEFEAVFIGQMVQAMFAGIETDEVMGGGHAEEIFRSVLNEEYANAMVEQGGIGIADQVMREILKLQEVQ